MKTSGDVHPILGHIRQGTVVGIALLALLNVADTVTTHLLLSHAAKGAVEANPLARVLIADGNLVYVKLLIVGVLGFAAFRDRPKLGFLIGVWLVVGFYAASVLSNLLLLHAVSQIN